ncbi:MAG: PilZ domain-containing protein [Acidimicrobiales bacterium]
METSEITPESRVILYFEQPGSTASRGHDGVIDLVNRAAIQQVNLEVLFSSKEAVFARAQELPEDFSPAVTASLVYPLFSESWRVPVRISPITDLGPKAYALHPLEEWEYLNRRAFVRVRFDARVTLVPQPEKTRLGIACHAVDLSNSGVGIQLPEDFGIELSDTVLLILHLDDGDLEVMVEIASRRGSIVGAQFSRLSADAEKRIGKAVFQAQIARKRLLVDDD